MKRKYRLVILTLALLHPALAIIGVIVWSVTPAAAQTSASYGVRWHVIGGGGQTSASTNYVVNGTAGQAAASPPYSMSADFIISGGYWYMGYWYADIVSFFYYLPLVISSP